MKKQSKRKRTISSELSAKLARLAKMQEANWKKHFVENPGQLLPGAEVERIVPTEEADLFAEILWEERRTAKGGGTAFIGELLKEEEGLLR